MLHLHPLPVPPPNPAAAAGGRGGAGGGGEEGGGAPGGPGAGPLYATPYKVPNAFAGSILNLEPDTDYEARFTLSDPDGVKGKTVQTANVRTRHEPMPAVGGKVYHVYPYGYKGTKEAPWFTGLLRAYYTNTTPGDGNNSFVPRVEPGDTILVHGGLYKEDRTLYGPIDLSAGADVLVNDASNGTPFDGTYYLRASGTPDKPIVIKAAGDGEPIFDGAGNAVLFDMMLANYNYFEGITFRNSEVAILTGRKELAGASGLTLKHCKIEDVGRGIWGDWSGSRDFYIADSVFVGRHNPNVFLGWRPGELWAHVPGFPNRISGPGGSELAVKVYGQGHVIAYNRVSGFHDGIDHATYGPPDGSPDHVIEENVPG
jgi:hypothetical protein